MLTKRSKVTKPTTVDVVDRLAVQRLGVTICGRSARYGRLLAMSSSAFSYASRCKKDQVREFHRWWVGRGCLVWNCSGEYALVPPAALAQEESAALAKEEVATVHENLVSTWLV
jgi:hypothetical protein